MISVFKIKYDFIKRHLIFDVFTICFFHHNLKTWKILKIMQIKWVKIPFVVLHLTLILQKVTIFSLFRVNDYERFRNFSLIMVFLT